MRISFAVRSDVGLRRTNNEDNLYCGGVIMTEAERDKPFYFEGVTEAPAVFAVFDGMGGEDCGELASLTAAEILKDKALEIRTDSDVNKYCVFVNRRLLELMRSQGIRCGSTLVLVVVGESSLKIYNLGDSRGFIVEDGRLLRATDDHTVAEEKFRMGMITAEQAEKSRERHMLTRYFGDSDELGVLPDVSKEYSFDRHSGGLLCSDGLTDMVKFPEISRIMKDSGTPSEAVNKLVDCALNNGGRDNVTCLAFKIED